MTALLSDRDEGKEALLDEIEWRLLGLEERLEVAGLRRKRGHPAKGDEVELVELRRRMAETASWTLRGRPQSQKAAL